MLRKRWKRQIFSVILAIALTMAEMPVPVQAAHEAEIPGETEVAEAATEADATGTIDGREEEEVLPTEPAEETYSVAAANDTISGLWTDDLTADADYTFGGGAGTAEDPYLIATATDLAMLELNVYEINNVTYSGKYFKQTANIDLAGKYWLPIGINKPNSYANCFRGVYDGGGHIIYNMTVDNAKDARVVQFAGLFGHVYGATIKNVGVQNGTVTISEGFRASNGDVALLLGNADNSGVTVENCFAQGNITVSGDARDVGGIVAQTYGRPAVKNCYFIGDITITGTVPYAGGIIGYRRDSSTILQNSYAAATISHASGTTYAITDGAENSYYDSTMNPTYTGGAGTAKTTAEMKTSEMMELLNDGGSVWAYDAEVNAGYPYLVGFVVNTVEFDVRGHGTAPESQTVIHGWKAVKPDDLTEAGYIFGGWYKEADFENKWDFDTDVVNEDTTLYAKWSVAPLTGTVTITGTLKYGETLTGTVTEDNNTGTLNYQWKRDDIAIEGADSATYVLAVEDIDKTLTLTVSSTEQPGSIVSEATDVVAKADSPDAPAGLTGIKPTNVAKDDGKITGTSTDMEYSASSTFADAAKVFDCTSEETVVPAPGTYYVRVKETATTKAGKTATVVVPDNTVYTVTVTAGANMAKTADSGEAAQSVVEETAITTIVYTAADGYYFPEDYASLGTKNGITVEWMDAGSIRISGTPTATVTLTLVAATQKPNRDGLVASFVMEAEIGRAHA